MTATLASSPESFAQLNSPSAGAFASQSEQSHRASVADTTAFRQRRLEALCDSFNTTCHEASQQLRGSAGLTDTEDYLWSLARLICGELRRLERQGDCAEWLEAFRCGAFAQQVVKWYRTSPDIDRLWTKPAGYSGDYYTIDLLCQNRRTIAQFSDIFRNHLVRCQMAEQHRGKVAAHAEFLLEQMLHPHTEEAQILVVGCGPSFDVRQALAGLPAGRRVLVTMVDLDPQAVRFSQERLQDAPAGVRFKFLPLDALRAMRQLLRDGAGGTFDAIIFGGLFDYLDDRCIALLLRKSMQLLNDTGALLFSQVSTNNPDRTFMKWLGDWELIERNEDALLRLCDDAEIERRQVTLARERTGIAILCRVGK